MKVFQSGCTAIAVALTLWASPAEPASSGVAAFYCGHVSFFSPDGKLPYEKTAAALKREVLNDGAHIIETLTQSAPNPGMHPGQIVSELERRNKTLVYRLTDRGGSFAGTVQFKDSKLNRWVYEVKLKAGGTTKGSGRLLPNGIQTERQLSGGGRPMFIKEDLNVVSERSYEMCLSDMRPPKGAE